jgi:hypothetical protein
MVGSYRAEVSRDPAVRTLTELYAQLADADADDPRVEPIARRMHPILSGYVAATDPPADDGPPSPGSCGSARC